MTETNRVIRKHRTRFTLDRSVNTNGKGLTKEAEHVQHSSLIQGQLTTSWGSLHLTLSGAAFTPPCHVSINVLGTLCTHDNLEAKGTLSTAPRSLAEIPGYKQIDVCSSRRHYCQVVSAYKVRDGV